MKELGGKITFLVGREETTIEITDTNSGVLFCKVTLTPEQLCSALSRLSLTECSIKVVGLDKVGKKHEHKEFEFEIPRKDMDKKELGNYSQIIINKEGEGWISDKYFGSQNSFFRKDGKDFARTIARRYI